MSPLNFSCLYNIGLVYLAGKELIIVYADEITTIDPTIWS